MPETPDFRSQTAFASGLCISEMLAYRILSAKPSPACDSGSTEVTVSRGDTEPGWLNSDDIAGPLNNRVRSGFLREWEGQAD